MPIEPSGNRTHEDVTTDAFLGRLRQCADHLRDYAQRGRRTRPELASLVAELEAQATPQTRLIFQATAPILRDDAEDTAAVAAVLDPIISRTPRGSVAFGEVEKALDSAIGLEADPAAADTWRRFGAAVYEVFARPGPVDLRELPTQLTAMADLKLSGLAWMDLLSAGRGRAVAAAANKALARKEHWTIWKAVAPQYVEEVYRRLATLEQRRSRWKRWGRAAAVPVAAGLLGMMIPLVRGSTHSSAKPTTQTVPVPQPMPVVVEHADSAPISLADLADRRVVVIAIGTEIDPDTAMTDVSTALRKMIAPPTPTPGAGAQGAAATTQPSSSPAGPRPARLIYYADTRAGQMLPASQLDSGLRVLSAMDEFDMLGGADYAVVVRYQPGHAMAVADLVLLSRAKHAAGLPLATQPSAADGTPLEVVAPHFCEVPLTRVHLDAPRTDLYPLLRNAASYEQLFITAEALSSRPDATPDDLAAAAVAYLAHPVLGEARPVTPEREARARQLIVMALQRLPADANDDTRSLARKARKGRFPGLENDKNIEAQLDILK